MSKQVTWFREPQWVGYIRATQWPGDTPPEATSLLDAECLGWFSENGCVFALYVNVIGRDADGYSKYLPDEFYRGHPIGVHGKNLLDSIPTEFKVGKSEYGLRQKFRDHWRQYHEAERIRATMPTPEPKKPFWRFW